MESCPVEAEWRQIYMNRQDVMSKHHATATLGADCASARYTKRSEGLEAEHLDTQRKFIYVCSTLAVTESSDNAGQYTGIHRLKRTKRTKRTGVYPRYVTP